MFFRAGSQRRSGRSERLQVDLEGDGWTGVEGVKDLCMQGGVNPCVLVCVGVCVVLAQHVK